MAALGREPLVPEDVAVRAAMRALTEPRKGTILGLEARPLFDAARGLTPLAPGVSLDPGKAGGVPGIWCRPADVIDGRLLLFLHGGGYMMGSAAAMTGFASQLAMRTRAATFVVDYRLAPEHSFPAAIDDAAAAFRGLASEGAGKVAIAGESAGGGLAIALLSLLDRNERGAVAAAAIMSPWLDLTLSGGSYRTRAEADPVFTRDALAALAARYLHGHASDDPRASPLFADPAGFPPIRVDVGDDEVLLDDTRRFAERAAAAGVSVTGAVWTGMPHVFQAAVGRLAAATRAMDAAGDFLAGRFDQP